MNTQQIANREPSSFELELQSYEPQFAAALPGHIPVEKFRRTVITALNAQPDLVKADRRSLFTACVRAAQDGLFPDGREAALVVFNTKNQKTGEWTKQVQFMPMVGGLIKRMRNSGELAAISAYVVFSNDSFDYELGDNPHINHKPVMGDRGQPIGVYAVAKLTNGEVLREVMSYSEVEKIRAVSRSGNSGPWVQWWEEMARKSVIRRLAKRLPGSADIDDMLRREEEQYQPQSNGAAVPAQRPTRAMFREPQITDIPERDTSHDDGEWIDPSAVQHDPETGEIEDAPEPSEFSLQDQGDARAEEGLQSLEAWWKGLTSSQRGMLGARGRATGAYLEGWKIRAAAADERGGPEPEPEPEEGAAGEDQNQVMEQDQREQNGEEQIALTLPDVPVLWKRDDGTADWTRWAGEMVGALRVVSSRELLERLHVVRDTHVPSCPMHIMMDIDKADKEAVLRVTGTSSQPPRF